MRFSLRFTATPLRVCGYKACREDDRSGGRRLGDACITFS